MRFLRYLPLATLMFVGACDQEASVTNNTRPPLAYIRYVHAVPDFGATDFKFIDAVEYSPVYAATTYRTVGVYQGVRAGSRQWKVFRNSSNIAETQQVLAEGTTDFVAGQYYTILHRGYAVPANGTPAQGIVLLDDTRPAQNAGLHISVVNAGSPAQDVYVCRPNTLTVLTGGGQTAAANGFVIDSIRTQVTDDCGYNVAGDSVRFAATQGGGSFSSAVVLTDANGLAATRWRLGAAGAQEMSVRTPLLGPSLLTGTIAPIATITVAPATANMVVGGTLQLNATVRDAGAAIIGGQGAITWSSSNTARATVSTTGLVTAVVPATVGTGTVGSVYIRAVGEGIRDSALINIDWPATIMAGNQSTIRVAERTYPDFMTTENFADIAVGSPSLVLNVAPFARTAYFARAALGRFTLRSSNAGTLVLATSATSIAGVAGTLTTDPVGGYNIAGTQFTAFIFPRSTAGTAAPQTAAFNVPAMLLIPDRQPPRTVPE